MIVELLTLGDELLDGRRVDTNTAWLGRRLTALGAPPRFRQTVSDRADDIAAAFRLALSRADIVISTGGLGPTSDDVTFEALAAAAGRKLQFFPRIHEKIVKRFEAKGLRCPESNRRQAMLPEGAVEIENEWGTAPGIRLDAGGKTIFSLPGVPEEMRNLFDRGVFAELEKQLGRSGGRIERIYRFVGISESHLEEAVERCRLNDIPGGEIRIAYTALFPEMDVTLSVLPADGAGADPLLRRADEAIRRELGEYLAAAGGETLEQRVVRELSQRGLTLAVAESFTGGLLAGKIIDVPGSSAVFERGVVAYSDRSKVETLGVSEETLARYGAVSEACALEMARGARDRSGARTAVSTTGIAGPGGATPQKNVGLAYLAWVGPDFEEVKRYQFRWDRNRNRMIAVFEAMKGLVRCLESVTLKH